MKHAILFLLSAFIIYGCGGTDGSAIKAPGMVEGEIITLKSRIASSVTKIGVEEGDEIEAGQELVSFDSRTVRNKIRDVELNLEGIGLKLEKLNKRKKLSDRNYEYLKQQVAKFERLNIKKSVSGDDLEKLKLRLLESETTHFDIIKSLEELSVQKNVLENNREYLRIVQEDYQMSSGVAGIVMEKFVSIGENIFPGTPVMDILDKESLFIEIFIEEKELFAVKTGDEVKIIVDGIEDKDIKGIVSEIGRKAEFSPKYVVSEVERKSLLYKVKVRLKGHQDIFKIGMPVTVLIEKTPDTK